MKQYVFLASMMLLFCFPTAAQQVLYVDQSATGGNDGSSWLNAYTRLNDALATADSNGTIDQIRVATGTYFPTGAAGGIDRHQSFIVARGGLQLLGGYPQGGGTPNWLLHPTILSGDIGIAGTVTDNSLHVLKILNIAPGSDSILVAGFVIQYGYANGTVTDTVNGLAVPGNTGAGVYICARHLRLSRLLIRNNYAVAAGGGIACIGAETKMNGITIADNQSDSLGGGIYFAGGHSRLSGIKIIRNHALLGGGVLADTGSRPLLLHSVVAGNLAGSKGGGWYNATGARPKLLNLLFAGNKANYQGSAWYSEHNDSVLLIQTTISGNKCDFNGGGAVHMQDHDTFPEVKLINSIVWGNSAGIVGGVSLSHTATTGSSAVGWNQDPSFVNPAPYSAAPDTLGDYHLTTCSPLLNMADNSSVPAALTTDLDGFPRIFGGAVDPGCYELQSAAYAGHRLYVDSSRSSSGDGHSWSTALKTLSEALKRASECASVDSIFVAKGTYFPTGTAAGTERDSTFLIPADGLQLIGGYPSGGGARSVEAHPTILSGAIGNVADATDNSYHVLVIAGVSDSVYIDGFTIRAGMAEGSGAFSYHNVSVSRDKGGGVYLAPVADSLVRIRNCRLVHNHAESGAGMYLSNAFAILGHVIISGNEALSRGGGLYAYAAATNLTNCLITGNRAIIQAGAVYNNNNSHLKVRNSTVSGNASSGTTGGIYNTASSAADLQNNIVYGNSGANLLGGSIARAYSLVQGWPGGTGGNINGTVDPLFVQPVSPLLAPNDAGDYRLLSCSPAINQGNASLVPQDLLQDLRQQPRIFGSSVDPGAFELQQPAGLPSDTVTQTICHSDSAWFLGQYYTVSGFYTDTLPGGACDSLAVLHLITLPPPVLLPVQTLDSCLLVSFEGQVYTSDTFLVDTFHYTGYNCDSCYRQISIDILQPDSSILDTVLCAGTSLQFGTQTFDSSGTYPVVFTGGNGCDSVVMLQLTVLPLQDTEVTVTICPGSSYSFNGQNLSVPGTYQATFSTSGCDSIVTLHLSVGNYATGSIAAGICAGDSFYFNGQNLFNDGVYSDTIVTATGCDSILTLTLTVHPTVSDTLFQSICNGSSYLFNGQNLSVSGTYADTFAAASGCDSIIVLHLTVQPPAQTLVIDTAGCGQVIFDGVTYTQSTQLFDTVTGTLGCDSLYTTIDITVWNNTPQTGSLDTSDCDAVFYKGTIYREDTSFVELFADIHGCDSFLQTTRIHVFSATRDTVTASICQGGYYLFDGTKYQSAGTYSSSYTTRHGCDSTLVLILKVTDPPELQVVLQPLPPQYCLGDKITLTASGALRYHWWNENGTNYGYTPGIRIRLREETNVIWLQGYDSTDCSAKKRIVLPAASCCAVFIPSAFTPNGDGLNDRFGVQTEGHPQNFRMRIYDRYGTLIFMTDQARKQWDGTVNGLPAATGTYYYRVTGNCSDGSRLTENGNVILIR